MVAGSSPASGAKLTRYAIKDNGDPVARNDGPWIDADEALAALKRLGRGEHESLPFAEKRTWTVVESLEWALLRIRTSLDCGTYYDKAMSALQEAQIAAERKK